MPRRTLIIIIIAGILLLAGILLAYFLLQPKKIIGALPETKKPELIFNASLNSQVIGVNNIYSFNIATSSLEKISAQNQAVKLLSPLPLDTRFVWSPDLKKTVIFTKNNPSLVNSPLYDFNQAADAATVWLYFPETNKKIKLLSDIFDADFSPDNQLAVSATSDFLGNGMVLLVDNDGKLNILRTFDYAVNISWLDKENLAVQASESEISGSAIDLLNIKTLEITPLLDQPIAGDFFFLNDKIIFDYFHESNLSYTLGIYDIPTKQIIDSGQNIPVSSLAKTPDKTKVVVPQKTNDNYTFFELNLQTGELLPLDYDHTTAIKDLIDIVFYPDSKNLLVNTKNGAFRLTVF